MQVNDKPNPVEKVDFLDGGDRLLILNDLSISRFKKAATALKKENKAQGKTLSQKDCLDLTSQKFGFETWKHLLHTKNYESEGVQSSIYSSETKTKYRSHTTRQLAGAIFRASAINPKEKRPIIQLILSTEDIELFQFNELDFAEFGLVHDPYLSKYLKTISPHFAGKIQEENYHYFQLLTQDTDKAEDTESHLQDFYISKYGFLSSLEMYIWVNGNLELFSTALSTEPPTDLDELQQLPDSIARSVYS